MNLEPFTVIGIHEGEPVHAWVLVDPALPNASDILWSRAVRQAARLPNLPGDCAPQHPDSFTGLCIAQVPGWHRPRFPEGIPVVPMEIRWLTNSSGEPNDGAEAGDWPVPYDFLPSEELAHALSQSVSVVGGYLVEVDGRKRAAFVLECMCWNGEAACPWPDERSATLWLDMLTEEILTRLPSGWAILPRHNEMPDRWALTIIALFGDALTCEGARADLAHDIDALLLSAEKAVERRIASPEAP